MKATQREIREAEKWVREYATVPYLIGQRIAQAEAALSATIEELEATHRKLADIPPLFQSPRQIDNRPRA